MKENPFLEKEEENRKYYTTCKPFQKEELTEAQKKRNLKGLKLVKEALEKVIPFRVN